MIDPNAEHSLYGPSAAHRRIACRGSANAEAGLPEETSEESADGSMHHAVLEKVLQGKGNAFAHVGGDYTYGDHTLRFDRDRARVVQEVADRVFEVDGQVYPEVRVSLEAWIPGQFGTSDIAIVRKDSLRIRDAKFGRGNVVIAKQNPQCKLYAAGFWDSVLREDPDVDPEWLAKLEAGEIPVLLEIDQPYKGNFDSWETTLPEILRFAEEYVAVYRDGQNPDAKRTAGPSQCEYCKAKPTCKPFTDYCLEALGMSTDDLDMDLDDLKTQRLDAQTLTPEQRAKLYQAKGLITKLLDITGDTLRDDYMAGRSTGGLKLIPGRSRRVWKDEAEAREALTKRFKKEDVIKESLISPTKALDLAGPRVVKKIEPLITYSESKPSLVPEDHKTAGIARPVDVFDDLDADDTSLDGFDLELDLDEFSLDDL